MRASSATCAKGAGVEDEAAAEKSCGSENVDTNSSICFSAILLAPSKFTLFEMPSDEKPFDATASILRKMKK